MTTIKPMLAHKLDETRIDWKKQVHMQPKLDGVRCLIQYEVFPISQGGARIVAYSRTGKDDVWISCYSRYDNRNIFVLQPDKIIEKYEEDMEYTNWDKETRYKQNTNQDG